MSHHRSLSIESTCTVLSCTSEEFFDLYHNDKLDTNIFYADARKIISKNCDRLHAANQDYHLDKLLTGMFNNALDPDGHRYVAVALHIAQSKGEGGDSVVDVAIAWMDHLFLPMLAISKTHRTEPSGSLTLTLEHTAIEIESASQSDQSTLRKKVAIHKGYYCAITHFFDLAHARELVKQGLEDNIPKGVHQAYMEAAHIIPLMLNNFEETTTAVRKAAYTWDMLQSWTRLDIKQLAGSSINTPANAIYMVHDQHTSFGQFNFYLDKEAYPDAPNKYKVQMAQKGFKMNAWDPVKFLTLAELGINPPNPEFLWIHAAFAKVLNLSGAAEYIEKLERDTKDNDALLLNKEVDYMTLLFSKFAIIAH